MKVIVFGAVKDSSINVQIKKEHEIIAYSDNEKRKWGELMAFRL